VATDRTPIPPDAFAAAIDRLDRDALAAFVGRLEAAADGGAEVAVDPPLVSVSDGEGRRRILVAPDGADIDTDGSDPSPDSVVVGPGESAPTEHDTPVRTAEDLRHQLLYAASPEAAASIAEEWLDVPVRSASYAPEPTPAATSGGDADAGTDTPSGSDPGASGEPSDAGPADTESADTESADTGSADTESTGTGSPEPTAGLASGGGPSATPDSAAGSDAASTRGGAGLVVIGVGLVILLAVAGGVVYAADISPDGDAGTFAASAPVESGGLSDADIDRSSRDPIEESGAVTTATPTASGGDGSGGDSAGDTETDRNVRAAPTCERSFLSVVQVQMNALRYNNNTTDDGIRTVRRFASPRNRQAIQTLEEFVQVIKSPTYRPMLSHDSAEFTPIQSSDDYAQVEVITREGGNVTGKYYFRVRKVDGGEYDGCWMTDAVVSVPESSNFSGKVGGQSTVTSGGTS
jgi:hypothetical protein